MTVCCWRELCRALAPLGFLVTIFIGMGSASAAFVDVPASDLDQAAAAWQKCMYEQAARLTSQSVKASGHKEKFSAIFEKADKACEDVKQMRLVHKMAGDEDMGYSIWSGMIWADTRLQLKRIHKALKAPE